MVKIRLACNLVRFTGHNCSYRFRGAFIDKGHRMGKDKGASKENQAVGGNAEAIESLKECNPLPDFIEYRQKLWDKFKAAFEEDLKSKKPTAIKVCAKNKDNQERLVDCDSWVTSPIDVAKKIGSKSWSDTLVIAKVDGLLWDLERPLEKDCQLEFLTFEDKEGKAVFWHSTAHVMGEALERLYSGHLCYGPPIEDGFYYDMYMNGHCDPVNDPSGDEKSITDRPNSVSKAHFPSIETSMKKICTEKQLFERLELTKDQLLEMFNYNMFKVRIIKEKVKEDRTTVYRCGSLIDLCIGPHIRNTGFIKAVKVHKASGSFWEGDPKAEHLQRVYGISFPSDKQMKEWIRVQEEAAARDHRRIGREQTLFFFHEYSKGSAFFSPKGALVYNKLMDFIRKEYRKRGFHEVISPNIFNVKLWETSGHWEHYKDNMFTFDIENEKYSLKPMNCPGHCIIFDSETRSWKDLPIRFASFGVLHRNELTGALSGLTRVRRFQQDDAHIFCSHDQIEAEIVNAIQFMKDVYSIFNFTFELVLSTRPESFIGDIELWNNAEEALKNALDKSQLKWGLNPGDGAFYGPKIDVTVKDALKRSHQCATIQLDFNNPTRFDLSYIDQSGEKKRPCIIHRAIFGSVERFIAILVESFAGKWPFWLSPRQVMVIPISDQFRGYGEEVKNEIYAAGFEAYMNGDMTESLNKKIRNAQLDRYNFILVLGAKERDNQTVNVRTRDNTVHGECSVKHLIAEFNEFERSKTLNAEQEFKAQVNVKEE